MLLVALVAPALLAGQTAGAQADRPHLELYAHWPASLGDASAGPIPINPLFPAGESDLSSGPATPQTTADGSLAAFTYRLENPDGSQGPAGPFHLDPTRPALLTFFLSADQTPWPAAVGEGPADADYGVAPAVTVTAELRVGQSVVGHASRTQDLVSLPNPAGSSVHEYVLEIPFDAGTIQAREGLFVDIEIHQVQAEGERAMQPAWNVHTGEDHPTSLTVPTQPGEHLSTHQGVSGSADGDELDRNEARNLASWALIASVAVAAVAAARLIGQARDL